MENELSAHECEQCSEPGVVTVSAAALKGEHEGEILDEVALCYECATEAGFSLGERKALEKGR